MKGNKKLIKPEIPQILPVNLGNGKLIFYLI